MAGLYGKGLRDDPQAGVTEKEIADLIDRNCCSEDYEQMLGMVEGWYPFYHLSVMRKGLFYWYDFIANSSLLEIGAGFGALTGVFCDRCRQVVAAETDDYRVKYLLKRYSQRKNLCVYHGDVLETGFARDFSEGFDYIVVTGLLERQFNGNTCRELYAGYLKELTALLKPSGHLLIAADNRYGIRYFCGAPEAHTKRPFDGINYYPFGTDGYSFSRQEFIDIIEKAGLKWKLYYPLPDYEIPQLVYSDAYLQGSSIGERLVPYYTDSRSLVAYEKNIYADLMENKVLGFFSNSFLAECTHGDEFCHVVYAALSTDRGKEHGFATTIRDDGTVEKMCLHQEGQQNLMLILENMRELGRNGIKTVEHCISGRKLVMPFVSAPTLSNVLQACSVHDPEEFFRLFDLLYDNILRSSRHVQKSRNGLAKKSGCSAEYGPVLEKAYIDMVPVNCFYMQKDLYFFDQEFVRENYPAGYVMYRAVIYTYMYMPQIGQKIPMEELKKRYQLEDAWHIYEKEELAFIEANRNVQIYGQFYKWAQVDMESIYNKIKYPER